MVQIKKFTGDVSKLATVPLESSAEWHLSVSLKDGLDFWLDHEIESDSF